MADLKSDLINSILMDMNDLSIIQQQRLQNSLISHLHSIDLVRESYELATQDDSARLIYYKFKKVKEISGRSPRTLEAYELRILQFLDWNTKPFKDITSDDIHVYLYEYKKYRNVSNTTLDNIRSALFSFFSWAAADGYIESNPLLKVDKIKKDTHKESPFDNIEIEKLRDACGRNLRNRALLEFMLATGCRVSEICSINVYDVDFKNKTLTVIGKGNKRRTVFINDTTVYHLMNYLNTRDYKMSDPLFATERVGADGDLRLKPIGVQTIMRRLGQKAGVTKVHPHRFRRTFCCNAVNKGMPIESAKVLLGHNSINTTMRYFNEDENKIKNDYMRII